MIESMTNSKAHQFYFIGQGRTFPYNVSGNLQDVDSESGKSAIDFLPASALGLCGN
jgi:hypothetical protein